MSHHSGAVNPKHSGGLVDSQPRSVRLDEPLNLVILEPDLFLARLRA